jgi:tRNA threonylcarbamoyladenosine biosynthesis protein TsaB
MIVEVNDRGEPVWCVGSGFVRYRNDAELITQAQFAPDVLASPSAEVLVEIAVAKIARDETVEARDIEPMYLRAPDAEINWAVREGA